MAMATSGKKAVDCQLVMVGAVDLENDEQLRMDVSQSLKRLSLSEENFPFKLNLLVFGDIIMVADIKESAIKLHRRHDGKLLNQSLYKKKSRPRGIFRINDDEIGAILEDGNIDVMSVQCKGDTGVITKVRTFKAKTGFDKFFNAVIVLDKLVVSGRIQKRILCWSIVSLNSGHAITIHTICSGYNSYVATKDNLIYFSCYCIPYSPENGAYAYYIDNPSTHKFTYKDRNLGCPRGITVDAKGFIFVCNMSQPCCIHHLTKECEPVTVYHEEIPASPYDIFWDQQQETLYLTTRKRNQIIGYKPVYTLQQVETPELPESIRSVQIGNQDVPMSSEELEQFKQLQIALEGGEDDDSAANSVDSIMQQGSEILKRKVLWHLARLLAIKIASVEKQTRFRIWPGTDLSTGKITFVCLHQSEFEKKLHYFFHIDIFYRRIGKKAPLIGIKKEDLRCTTLTENDASLIDSAIEMHGDKLFTQHINLQAVCGGPFMLHENRKEDCVEQRAVVILYCLPKGIKPYGEDPFPSVLSINGKDIPVDIREGYFAQTVGVEYSTTLCMGISIGGRDKLFCGTLGPFVNLGKDGNGFITCAHVVGDKQTDVVQPSENDEDLGREDFTQEQLDTNICGHVLRRVLNPEFLYRENGVTRNVGVDAALVRLNGQRPITPNRFPDVDNEVLHNMGFREDTVFRYTDGSFGCPRQAMSAIPVFKYGRTTGFTRGYLTLSGTMVRMVSMPFHYEDDTPDRIMHALCLIDGPNQFADEGDSGAGVFIIRNEDDQEPMFLTLIGIVLGVIPNTVENYCLVMPIEHVLQALKVEPNQLILDNPNP